MTSRRVSTRQFRTGLLRHLGLARVALLGVALVILAACGGSDEGSSAVQERFTGEDVESSEEPEGADGVELVVPTYDPAVVAEANLDFLPDIEAACVAERIGQGMNPTNASTLNGCVSADSVAVLLDREGLPLSASESLCVFDARAEFEVASLEAESTVQNLDLLDQMQRDTVNCMTDETVASRSAALFPSLSLTPEESRCSLQSELVEPEAVFEVAAWCGIAGRYLNADGLGVSDDGATCIDQLGQAALPETTEELPLLVSDCVSADDQSIIDAAYS